MNYIKRLEQEKAELQAQLAAHQEQIAELRRYLLSDKFHGIENAWVNPQDVLNRLTLF